MKMLLVILIVLALVTLGSKADPLNGVGINYGRLGNNLPPPSEVVKMFQQIGISQMRLFDPDIAILDALKNTDITLTLGIPNQELQTMAISMERVTTWFNTYIAPYINDIVFEHIVVGNELVPGDLAIYIVPVMHNFQTLLDVHNLHEISLTTAVATTCLGNSFPPSQSVFSDQSREVMIGILGFLSAKGNPLLVNLYPYFAYASDPQNIPLEYAQLNSANVVVQDGLLGYTNLLDAMFDSFIWSMEKVGFGDVDIVISESGWPSDGNGGFTTPSLAATYNQNFVRKIASMGGTPKRPQKFIEGFVFAMFNENNKPPGVEQNFGLFYPDMKPVYQVFSN